MKVKTAGIFFFSSSTSQICNASFATRDRLRSHLACHEDKIPCKVCGKFLRAAYMTDHLKKHSEGTHNYCGICNKGNYLANVTNSDGVRRIWPQFGKNPGVGLTLDVVLPRPGAVCLRTSRICSCSLWLWCDRECQDFDKYTSLPSGRCVMCVFMSVSAALTFSSAVPIRSSFTVFCCWSRAVNMAFLFVRLLVQLWVTALNHTNLRPGWILDRYGTAVKVWFQSSAHRGEPAARRWCKSDESVVINLITSSRCSVRFD